MITKQNFCEVTLRLSTASESRTKTYDAPCRVQNYLRISANNVESSPTTLKGGTNGITVVLSFGMDMKTIPVRKFINSGENFFDKLTLSAIIEATKRPEAKLCLEFTLHPLSI